MPSKPVKYAGSGVNRRIKLFEFLLDANRNLLIILMAVFGASIFAVSSDSLLSKGKDETPGVVSGVTLCILLLLSFVSIGMQAWLVYAFGVSIGTQYPLWFLFPVFVFAVSAIPIITYMSLLYSI